MVSHALRVLEFDAIRARLRARCETPMASALADALEPSFESDRVWESLAATGEAYDAVGRHSLPPLATVRDLRNGARRASKGGTLGGSELFQIGEALATMRALKTFLAPRRQEYPRLWPYSESLPELERLERTLLDSLESDGTVRDAASPALATLRQRKRAAAARVQERVNEYTTGRTRELLSDPIVTVRDGRYVVPLKAENRGKIRGIVHDTSGSGQTIFLEPEDVVALGNALREVEAAERQEEQRILLTLSGKAGGAANEILGGLDAATALDLLFAKARLGYDMKAVLPERRGEHRIEVQGGRHPLLDGDKVVPLELAVGKGSSVLITGPNTGGKTVAIKAVGLFVVMAQSGLMIPALAVGFSPFTQVWADIGDEQSLQQSLSTFSGHIKNISEALRGMRPGGAGVAGRGRRGHGPGGGGLAGAGGSLRDGGARRGDPREHSLRRAQGLRLRGARL
jgi:DNA mismatch repair protein MutS2